MVDFNDDTNGRQGLGEPPDATRYAVEPQGGHEPHPLFPRQDGSPEDRDIHLITFCRRRSDGRIDHSPEDIRAGEIHTWAQVVGPWGGGEYKAIGKDKSHRIVAWYPEKHGDWLLFDSESKPFTLRDQRYAHSPPAPLAPPALTPVEYALLDLVRELRSSQASSTFSMEAVMVEMIKSQGEILHTVLSAVLPQGLREIGPQPKPTAEERALAEQLLHALREPSPAPYGAAPATDGVGARRRRAVFSTDGVGARRRRAVSSRREVRLRRQKP